MFGMQSPQQQGSGMGIRESFNLFYILLRGYSLCMMLFLRRRIGSEVTGLSGVVAILVMIVYMAGCPASTGMPTFFGLWWVMLIGHRLAHFNYRRKGLVLHSQYEGESLVGVALPFLNFSDIPQFLDVLICLGIGYALHSDDPALGNFIFGGGIALLIKGFIDHGADGKEIQVMHDAEIEMRAKVARFRRGRF